MFTKVSIDIAPYEIETGNLPIKTSYEMSRQKAVLRDVFPGS